MLDYVERFVQKRPANQRTDKNKSKNTRTPPRTRGYLARVYLQDSNSEMDLTEQAYFECDS